MAVLPGTPWLSVSIMVEGQVAREYNDPDGEQEPSALLPATSCYIESKSGAEFAIETRIAPSNLKPPGNRDTVCSAVSIDGAVVSNVGFVPTTSKLSHTAYRTLTRSTKAGQADARRFIFSPVTKVDDDCKQRVASDRKIAKHLGTIKVEIYLVKTIGKHERKHSYDPKANKLDLSEKSMKGKELSHGTTYSKLHTCRAHRSLEIEDKLRLGTLYFHYRSEEALYKELIIPRPSTTAEAELEAQTETANMDDIANLSEDEIRRLAKERLREINSGRDGSRAVKREANAYPVPSRPLKVVKLDGGRDAIDLTGDD